jgi:hypothetical protein
MFPLIRRGDVSLSVFVDHLPKTESTHDRSYSFDLGFDWTYDLTFKAAFSI